MHRPRIDASAGGSLRAGPAMAEAGLEERAKALEVEAAEQLVFPKLHACPSGAATPRAERVAPQGAAVETVGRRLSRQGHAPRVFDKRAEVVRVEWGLSCQSVDSRPMKL